MAEQEQTPKQLNPPNLQNLLDELKRDVMMNVNCIQVGIIQSFDASNQSATIKIAMKQLAVIQPDGTKLFRDYPLILECPVMFLFGGAAFISMPIEPGDNCIVLFNDRDIDRWFTAGDGQVPTTVRIHDMSDAFAIVGIKNLVTKIPNYLTGGIRIFLDENTQMDITPGQFTITGNLKVLGNLETDFAGKQIRYNDHTHGGVQSGPSNTDVPNDI